MIYDKEHYDQVLAVARSYRNDVERLEKQLVITEKALEMACEDCPIKCSNQPERYNLQDEYGSDEPYWVEEGGCEFDGPANCLECTIKYYKQKAKEMLENENIC